MRWGHLSRDELVGLVDGGDWEHPHLASCARCRREVDELRAMVVELRGVPVPEPSPLFWEHLTRRVREAVDAEPRAGGRVHRPWWALVPVTLVVAVALGLLWSTLPPPPEAGPDAQTTIAAALPDLDLDDLAAPGDDSWEVMLALSDEVSWENGSTAAVPVEGAGGVAAAWPVAVGPSSADEALLALTDEERALVRELLMEEQGRGNGAAAPPQG